MSNDFTEFGLGPCEGPLEKILKECRRQKKGKGMTDALEAAIRLGGGPLATRTLDSVPDRVDLHQSDPCWREELRRRRHEYRRERDLSPADISELADLAQEAGKESYFDWYALMEIVQAAAVPVGALAARAGFSGLLAFAAKNCGQHERARQAYAGCFEELRIMERFALVPGDSLREGLAATREGWLQARAVSRTTKEPFDTADPDPAGEWFELLLWNSDLDEGQGLLAQVEASLRLALRFEDWKERLQMPLDQPVAGLIQRCLSWEGDDPFLVRARLATSVGDALIEVRQWELAAETFQRILGQKEADLVHPLWVHALLQEAYARLMGGHACEGSALMAKLDIRKITQLSELVITVKAELARCHALRQLCAGPCRGSTAETRAVIAPLLRDVSIIASREPRDRTESLRTLFVNVLRRDLDRMLSGA
jgi:hypothetical protein